MSDTLSMSLGDLNEEGVLSGVKQQLSAGTPALRILDELQKGMEVVGRRYEKGEYFLSELIMAADIFKSSTEMLGPELQRGDQPTLGTIVIGTVSGDIHDFGKDIVGLVLGCNGLKVVDLGVDVPYERFVQAVEEHKPRIVGLSCLLTTAYDNMKATVEALEAAGLRDQVKVIVGGGPVDQSVCAYVKADAYGKNAQEAVDVAKKLLGVS